MRFSSLAACLVVLCLPAAAFAQLIELDAEYFVTPTGVGTGVGLVTGDWNEDGKDDLAAITTGGHVACLMGLGSFRLQAAPPIALGESGWAIASGDLDGDGHLDLVAGALANTYLLLGDGTGNFSVAATLPYPGWDVALARMDADADLDLVLSGTGRIRVLRLQNLGVEAADSVDVDVESLDVGDFDEDGDVDVVADYQGGLGVWLNAGTGALGPVTLWQPSGDWWDASRVSVGDLNGDGHLDAASVNSSPYSCCLTIYGRGDGTFQYSPPSSPTRAESASRSRTPNEPQHVAPGPHFIVLADLNGDGRDEGITLCDETGNEVMGRRSTPSPKAAAIGDFDDDGQVDVAVLSNASVAVHPVGPGGVMRTRWEVGIGYPPSHGALADLDGDGKAEMLVRTEEDFVALRGAGDGGFTRYSSGLDVSTPFTLGDFDGDGHPDLVWTNGLHLGNGDGTFDAAPVFPGFPFYSRAFATGDLDGDDDLDLLVESASTSEVIVWLGNGAGGLTEGTHLPGATWQLSVADFDGDGALDFARRELDGAFVRFGDGNGGFGSPVTLDAGIVTEFMVGDVDGDGHPDLAAARNDVARTGLVFFSRGASFELAEGGFLGWPVAIGTLDADGNADLVAHSGLETTVLRGHGDGTFTVDARLGPSGIAFLDDRDDDGRLDLLIARGDDVDGYSSSVSIYRNVTATKPVAVEPREHAVGGLRLGGIRPQPTRGAATFSFRLPTAGAAEVEVHDVQGRRVASRRWEHLAAGDHARPLDLALAPGVYHVVLHHAGERRTMRAVVLR